MTEITVTINIENHEGIDEQTTEVTLRTFADPERALSNMATNAANRALAAWVGEGQKAESTA